MLATLDDLETRLGHAVDNADRAEALLADASAAVVAYTGQTFVQETTTARIRVRRGQIRLPQRPVTEVSAIADVDGVDVTHTWDGGSRIDLTGNPLNWWEINTRTTGLNWVDVTYTHGYETVPSDVIGVVCQMAARALGRAAEESGITQESIAGYSYTVGSVAAAGAVGMLPEEKTTLDRYRRLLGQIEVAY